MRVLPGALWVLSYHTSVWIGFRPSRGRSGVTDDLSRSGAPPGRRSRCLVLGKDALCQRELAVQVAQCEGIEPSPRGLEPRWSP